MRTAESEESSLLNGIERAGYPILTEDGRLIIETPHNDIYIDIYKEEGLPLTVVLSLPYDGGNLVQTFVEPTAEEILERLDEGYLR
jgi:hypothetical protein